MSEPMPAATPEPEPEPMPVVLLRRDAQRRLLQAGCTHRPSTAGGPAGGPAVWWCPGARTGGCEVASLLRWAAHAAYPDSGLLTLLDAADEQQLCDTARADLLRALTRVQAYLHARTAPVTVALAATHTLHQLPPTAGPVLPGTPAAGQVEDGGREEIGFALRISPSWARYELHDARTLTSPAWQQVHTDLAGGLTTSNHVRVLLRGTRDLSDPLTSKILTHPRTQRALRGRLVSDLRTVLAELTSQLADPAELAEAERAAAQRAGDRRADVRPDGAGSGLLLGRLSAVDAEAAATSLDAAVRRAQHTGDPRSQDQIRSDHLASLFWEDLGGAPPTLPRPDNPAEPDDRDDRDDTDGADGADDGAGVADDADGADEDAGVADEAGVAVPGRPAAHDDTAIMLAITISLDALAGITHHPGQLGPLGRLGPISAALTRALADAATACQLHVHDSNGQVLHASRTYRFPPATARTLRARYPTCTFPGCPTPATHPATGAHLDLDHRIGYQQGGPTSLDNGAPLCRRHHNLKTHHHWHTTTDPAGTGTLTWTSPTGQTAHTDPTTCGPHPEHGPPPQHGPGHSREGPAPPDPAPPEPAPPDGKPPPS